MRVFKAQPRRSRIRLSKCLQEQLLNTIADLQQDTLKVRSTNVQQSEAEDGRGQLAEKMITVRHPKPMPPYVSFLENFIDPSQSDPCTDLEHNLILKWLESVGSDRDTYCRSDSYLQLTKDDPIPRGLTKSEPAMSYTEGADGSAGPQTPASVGSYPQADADNRSITSSNITGSLGLSRRSLVESPLYREINLAANNIYIRPLNEQLPVHITEIVQRVKRDRDSPGPSSEDIRQDTKLNELWMGAGEPDVENYFRDKIFPTPEPSDTLKRNDRQPMAKYTIPSTGFDLKVSTPVPDMLFGYNRLKAFPQQQAQLFSMGTEMVANSQGLMYPFFVIEFKGEGPSGAGNLWVATNQCLGGSASCVNMVENLNHRLMQCKNDLIRPIDSAAFSIAMSGTEARLYISWKNNKLDYYMSNVDNFLLHDPEHFLKFRKYVRNIIDWGRDERMEGIRKSLDDLLEESRKIASAAAKSRVPPSADPTSNAITSIRKMRKTS
ncbi:unnamed protein product [Clonostachys rosea f. rosea IK726]|uniref:Uncharacterized protein n=1 Tax=Clonostachys rosea f. rosea IK726 TaxID=1349383 RepID=A0ACA9TDB1_BIOOC|nr:unnamed protein product [Clonostachys rosea f. rosea IK726]